MKFHVCPTCQRPITRPVNIGGKKRQALYDLVAAHADGVSQEQIMQRLYGDDPNGGPDSINTARVTISHINRILKNQRRGVRISARQNGGLYRLVAV